MAASPPAVPTLSRTLRSRHVALISIGGIIGAGLFVGSSANISTVGPAVLVSYAFAGSLMFLVMRMLAEMAAAEPARRVVRGPCARRARPWAGLHMRLAVLVFLGRRRRHRGDRGRRDLCNLDCRCPFGKSASC